MSSPLIRPEVLKENLEGARLLDARTDAEAYVRGHLPGAVHASLDAHLSAALEEGFDPARGGRHPLPRLQTWLRQLGDWGIDATTPVVVYDDQGGANAAARAWWMLRSIGHEHVWVLDGGLQAALEAGLGATAEVPEVKGKGPYAARFWQWPTVDLEVVDQLRAHAQWKVLDVRSAPRYRGEVEPLDPVAGHIPGALNLPFSENLGPDGRFKAPDALRDLYEPLLGNLRPDHLVVHCGSGVTACHTLLALEQAGLPGAALFVGSWSQWCRSDRPQAKGSE